MSALNLDMSALKSGPKVCIISLLPHLFQDYSALITEFNSLSVMFGKLSKDFILQQVPYIMGDLSDSSGAGQ